MSKVIYQRTDGLSVCRICRGSYVDSVESDRTAHREEHKRLAQGGMPRAGREFLKTFGWAVAHNDGGLERAKGQFDAEDGKLAVVYSWWMRARLAGCPAADFDRFMAAHFTFADATVGNDPDELHHADQVIKPWERFAG